MLKTLIVALGVLTAGPALAGCYDYSDLEATVPAPIVVFCYVGTCVQTKVLVECGNATGATVIYANGWQINEWRDGEGGEYLSITRDGVEITDHFDTLTIERIDVSTLPPA